MNTEPGSEIAILRGDCAALAAKVEKLLEELKTAVQYCSKQYWTDGHGERVQETYGFDVEMQGENGN